jgi:CRISPR/Cas system-associated exonuclease Cas4 (RecB family)
MNDFWNEEKKNFSYGSLPPAMGSAVPSSTISLDDVTYTVRNISEVVKQVIPASEYLTSDGDVLASRINSGKVMHEVFQRIKTSEDVDQALITMLLDGKIRESEQQELTRQIRHLISAPHVKNWFSGDWNVLTEAAILMKDGSMPRPDRILLKGNKAIVIDYKFGVSEHPSHQTQVRNYMKYLKMMGVPLAEGFLWYVTLNKVVSVSFAPEQGRLF